MSFQCFAQPFQVLPAIPTRKRIPAARWYVATGGLTKGCLFDVVGGDLLATVPAFNHLALCHRLH
jgi:hypothetical protein